MKKVYILPNLVTTANMFFGFSAMIEAYQGDFTQASWNIFLAVLCDLMDGRIARMAKATSDFGVEYDSLSDLVSFGVAPAFMIYLWVLEIYGKLGLFVCFLFMVCGALRLARFNITTGTDAVGKGEFQGLPIPAGAAIMASFILFNEEMTWPQGDYVAPFTFALMLACSILMVSKLPFPSFKEFNWRSKASQPKLLIGMVAVVLAAIKPQVVFFLLFSGMTLGVIAWNLLRQIKKPPLTQS